MTDLYPLEKIPYIELAKRFKDYPIVIFPQTINYNDWTLIEDSSRIFNSHGRITLMCRDDVSYEKATIHFPKCNLLLKPDIVTTLIGTMRYQSERNGLLICMRHDNETCNSIDSINKFINRFAGYKTKLTDTTLPIDSKLIIANREKMLYDLFEEYSHYKVVVTDRYHGTIFSLIASTPVIVVGTRDHKLRSGVKWFPNEYKDYIKFVNSLDEAYEEAMIYLQNSNLSYCLPSFFQREYYDNLKQELPYAYYRDLSSR